MTPKVTVLMSVYNGGKYLREAVDSILNQTFTDFEFLIIDDGSTDDSLKICKSYQDHRIRIVENGKNIGLIKSLNKGLKLARGKYIARMDADDVSMTRRFEKQVAFMDANPEIGVCGTWLKTFGETTRKIWKTPVSYKDVCAKMFHGCSLLHPSVIIRKDVLINNNLFYDENFLHVEDYKLWVDMAKVTRFANLPEVLLRYRLHGSQVTKFLKDSESQSIRNILAENFLGRTLTQREKNCHESLFLAKPYADTKTQQDVEQWVGFLEKFNAVNKIYAEPIFSRTIRQQCFYYSIRNNKRYCPFLLSRFFLSKQKYFLCFSVMELVKICVKCLILWPNKKLQEKRNIIS